MKETRYLITSASPEQLDAQGLLDTKRGYWAIESKLHYRLDEVLEEDKSRVRAGPAACILGMCRRLAVGFACEWLRREKGAKKHSRKSTRQFSGASRRSRRCPRLRADHSGQPHRMASKLEKISRTHSTADPKKA